jgi:hypothetical protein
VAEALLGPRYEPVVDLADEDRAGLQFMANWREVVGQQARATVPSRHADVGGRNSDQRRDPFNYLLGPVLALAATSLRHDRLEERVIVAIGIEQPHVRVAASRLGEANLPTADVNNGEVTHVSNIKATADIDGRLPAMSQGP